MNTCLSYQIFVCACRKICTRCYAVKLKVDLLSDHSIVTSLTSLLEGTIPNQNEVKERLQLSQVELEHWTKT
jgi:hypothetical protein